MFNESDNSSSGSKGGSSSTSLNTYSVNATFIDVEEIRPNGGVKFSAAFFDVSGSRPVICVFCYCLATVAFSAHNQSV